MDTLDAVLQLSRLQAGADEGTEAAVPLRERARILLEREQATAEEEGVELTVEMADEPVVAQSNEAAVDQILGNLLDNAIKFTLKGGQVWFRVWPEGDQVVVEVEDTGVGIGQEALSEIFRAFHQESKGLNRQFEGTGLGLAVTKRLVEQIGGCIEVESEKGEGSCFTVRLPRAEAPPGGPEADEAPN
jgi:signal transduction histidine kinase